ncbi:MAG TPA: hypothetical protein VHX86_02240 [Tepidisphaeraceae bacterium]|jgi:hypothetical protein|nr:hypothetical protein [Tepidisphaeraceae bacterium]
MAATLLAATPIVRGQAETPLTNGGAPTSRPSTMQFKKFVIMDDPNYTGMEVTRGLMPMDWTLKGGPVWNLADGRPMQLRIHLSDPQDVAAFDVYPNHFFYWSRQAANQWTQQEFRYMGSFVESPPADQFQAFTQVVVARDRPDLAQAHIVKQERLPEVAKAAYASLGQNPNYVKEAAAGRITFEYDLKGQAVQEEFYIVYEQAVNQRLGFMDWQVINVTSTRAPKGTLDQLNALRAVITRSCQPNLAFYTKVTNFVLNRQRLTLQRLNDQEQQREVLQNARSDANDAEKQAYDQHMNDLDRQSDAEADVQREVSPWKDSDGTTYKLPTQYGNAWSGADGRIIMNNDPQYNPNSDSSLTPTNWTPMQQAGN